MSAWPPIDDDIRAALEEAYRSGAWGRYDGGLVTRLEQRLAEYHEVPYALACGSGTFAVELALRALRVGPDDEVILAGYDYPGNFLSVHAVGARPVLVDVATHNWNLDPQALLAPERAFTFGGLAACVGGETQAVRPPNASTKIAKPRAVIASHLHGGVVPMRELMDFAAAHDVAAIEDAAQCPGAIVQGRRAGTWGDVGVLSFGGSKLLTAGRGGAILTRRADVYQRAKVAQMRGNVVCPLSELQAAVLLPQLDKLDARNRRRGEAVRYLTDRLTGLPGLRPFVNTVADSQPSYYKVGFQYDETAFGLPRSRLTAALRAEGIAFDEGFRGLHVGRSPERFRAVGDLTEATRAHHGTLILHHPVLSGSDADLDIIVEVLHRLHANE